MAMSTLSRPFAVRASKVTFSTVGALLISSPWQQTRAFSIVHPCQPQLRPKHHDIIAASTRSYRSTSGTLLRESYPEEAFAWAVESATLHPQHHQDAPPLATSESYPDADTGVDWMTEQPTGSILGGDFCGILATYHPGDGHLIPLPEYLVPDALREWGQEPLGLEVIVSESFETTYDGEHEYGTKPLSHLIRDTVTVLPDTGCGIDNLETKKASDDIDLSSQQIHQRNNCMVALQYTTGDDLLRVETVFKIDETDESGTEYRMRVIIDLVPAEAVFAVETPMVLLKERRTSPESSVGTIADGGGLDGRTVSQLMGNISPNFLKDPNIESAHKNVGIQYVNLPGGVEIAYGWTNHHDWTLQVSHLQNKTRRVVSRHFRLQENEENDEISFHVQMWEELNDLSISDWHKEPHF